MRETRETDHRLFAPSSFHRLLVGEPRRKAIRIGPSCSYRLGGDVVEEYQSGKIALSGRGQEDIMVVAVLNWSTHPLDINVPPLHPFQMDPMDIV